MADTVIIIIVAIAMIVVGILIPVNKDKNYEAVTNGNCKYVGVFNNRYIWKCKDGKNYAFEISEQEYYNKLMEEEMNGIKKWIK
jgi:hypothetical protein